LITGIVTLLLIIYQKDSSDIRGKVKYLVKELKNKEFCLVNQQVMVKKFQLM